MHPDMGEMKKCYMTKKLDYKTDWFLKLNPEGSNTTGCDSLGLYEERIMDAQGRRVSADLVYKVESK